MYEVHVHRKENGPVRFPARVCGEEGQQDRPALPHGKRGKRHLQLKHLGVKDKRVVSILSGANMDVITMSSVVQQGLIFRDRIFTVSVLLPDKPGELAKVSQTLADVQGNVIKLEHNQFVTTNRSAAVELRITLECFGTEHKEQIIAALEKKGYKPRIVRTMI